MQKSQRSGKRVLFDELNFEIEQKWSGNGRKWIMSNHKKTQQKVPFFSHTFAFQSIIALAHLLRSQKRAFSSRIE